MKIAIVGFATDGVVSAQYFHDKGHEVTVCDQDEGLAIPEQYKSQLGSDYLKGLDRFDVIVRSSGIHPEVILAKNPDVQPRITTAVNEFLAHCPTKNTIGITGTKGKGTTSTLTAKMLEAAGKKVWLGGNIGRSPLEFIDEVQPDDWVVLELSSFQLYDLQHSPHIAVCLMVVAEHLNWHSDMPDYIGAKSRLFENQTADDIAIYFAENDASRQIAEHGEGQKLAFYAAPGAYVKQGEIVIDNQAVCETDELALLGKHNWQNACAAVTAVWQTGVRDTSAMATVLTSFSGLEHRLEFVRTHEGVSYYDDSFGTTPETAIVAMQAFSQPKIVILGGSDKGASYGELAQAVAHENVRHALLIGDEAAKIQQALDRAGFKSYSSGGTTMQDIIANARSQAQQGDIVLLSTGCASFGLFKDYKDRGNQFKSVVSELR